MKKPKRPKPTIVELLRAKQTRKKFRELHGALLKVARCFEEVPYDSIDRAAKATNFQAAVERALAQDGLPAVSCGFFRESFASCVRFLSKSSGTPEDPGLRKAETWLRDTVLNEVSQPWSVHIDDLCEAFAQNLCVEEAHFDVAYDLFVLDIESRICERSTSLMVLEHADIDVYTDNSEVIRELRAAHHLPDRPEAHPERAEFAAKVQAGPSFYWENESTDLRINVQWDEPVGPLYLALYTHSTKRAIEALRADLEPAIAASMRLGAALHEEIEWSSVAILGLEPGLIAGALDALCKPDPEKNTLLRCVRNAILLATQAERVPHDGLALASTMAAIEALLGTRGPEIGRLMAERVAALLEPDSRERPAAVKFVKELYDERSRIMHGEFTPGQAERREQARILLAGVLKAVLERAAFLRRSGYDPESPDELLKEIDNTKFGPGPLTGVSESPARRLWLPKLETKAEPQSGA